MPGIILNDGTKARTPVTEHSSTLFQILHYENNLRKSANQISMTAHTSQTKLLCRSLHTGSKCIANGRVVEPICKEIKHVIEAW